MPNLADLITAADNVLSVLEGLLGADSAETPIPDPSVTYPIPVPRKSPTTGSSAKPR